MQQEGRYRFLALLGEGGSARVYRAQRLDQEGFARDVAIKVLADEPPSKTTLSRLWAEAALLGSVRDRAVVPVEPPQRLGDRWVVIMEYVDGVTLAALLARGPLPPGAAVEVAEELARALHALSCLQGPDGAPLQLVHRDIKPGNLQLTPAGEVRLLDFGNARWRGQAEEGPIAGTPGYIAPERARGEDGPEGDVFALGTVLHEMVTGARPQRPPIGQGEQCLPDPRDLPDPVSPEVSAVLSLAAAMRTSAPEARPSAREVQRACRALRRRLPGESLHEWAARHVPRQPALPPDERVGRIFPEEEIPRKPPGSWPRWAMGALLAAVALAVLRSQALTPEPPPRQEARMIEAIAHPAPAMPEPVPLEEPPSPPAETAPFPAVARVQASARPRPSAPPPPEPPAPAQPPQILAQSTVQAEAPAAPHSYEVLILSIPFGARVESAATGELLGQTPLRHRFPSGPHPIRLVSADGRSSETTIAVGRSMPVRYVWKTAEDRWESGY